MEIEGGTVVGERERMRARQIKQKIVTTHGSCAIHWSFFTPDFLLVGVPR